MGDRERLSRDDLPPEAVEAIEELGRRLFPSGTGYIRIDLEDGVPTALLALPQVESELQAPEIEPPSPN